MTPDEQRDLNARTVTDWQVAQRVLRANLQERSACVWAHSTGPQRLHQGLHANGLTVQDRAFLRSMKIAADAE